MRVSTLITTILLLVGCAFLGCAPRAPEEASSETRGEREELLELIARGYYPGRSGQIFYVTEPGDFYLRRPMGLYRFMHGSPWDYDRRIPLLFYGPGYVTAGAHSGPAGQQDVAPTLLRLLGRHPSATMTGRVLDGVFSEVASPPKAVVLIVLDGMRRDYFDRYADDLPTLTAWREDGAWFDEARVNYVPTVTSAGHTTVATGTDPRYHGIAGNGYYDRRLGRTATLFEGLSPANMMVPGLADLWNLATDGRAVIITQGTTPRATVSLGGHGACMPNGRATILAMFDYRSEGFVTNEECFSLPEYLSAFRARSIWEEAGNRWRDFEIEHGRHFVTTALYPKLQFDALLEMIEREGAGNDELTDLVLVNVKSPDYVGHYFGPESEEMRETLAAIDRELTRVVDAFEEGSVVFAVTADHGMPSEPDGETHDRRFIRELIASVHDALDPEGRLLFEYLDTANFQLYVDEARLEELGLELSDISDHLVSMKPIRWAYTEDEVAGAFEDR